MVIEVLVQTLQHRQGIKLLLWFAAFLFMNTCTELLTNKYSPDNYVIDMYEDFTEHVYVNKSLAYPSKVTTEQGVVLSLLHVKPHT